MPKIKQKSDMLGEFHDEGYFASFTDLLVGVLFIFIIMLMVFATNYQKEQQKTKAATEALTKINMARDSVLSAIEKSLKDQGIQVTIDLVNGVLRLPEELLFAVGSSDLNPNGMNSIRKLRETLIDYLPCIAVDSDADQSKCDPLNLPPQKFLEAVLVEGHASTEGENKGVDNLGLSAARSRTIFTKLIEQDDGKPSLLDKGIRNANNFPILGMSAYGSRRPVSDVFAQNRRIDLRFIMRSPTAAEIEALRDKAGLH